jgi:hypothetical protein
MNRLKKEELKNPKSPEELKRERFEDFLKALFFPEETDWQYDDAFSKDQRKNGINPMNEEYANQANMKREALGVTPLGPNGLAVDNTSGQLCEKLSQVIRIDSFGFYLTNFNELVNEE